MAGWGLSRQERQLTREAFERVVAGIETVAAAAARLDVKKHTLQVRWERLGLGDPQRQLRERQTRTAHMAVLLRRDTVASAAAKIGISESGLQKRFVSAGLDPGFRHPQLPKRIDPRKIPRADTAAAYTLIRLGRSTTKKEAGLRGVSEQALHQRFFKEGLHLYKHPPLPADAKLAEWTVALEAGIQVEWCDRIVRERDVPDRLLARLAPELLGIELERVEMPLTPMQVLVLQGLVDGLQEGGIAARLCLAVATVHTHVKHIRWRLGAKTNPQAAAIGLRRGFVSHPDRGESPPDVSLLASLHSRLAAA